MIFRPGQQPSFGGVQIWRPQAATAGGGSPPTTNLQLWLKADSYSLSDGTTIATNWTDSSPAARTVAPTGGVTFETNELNTLPIVRFNGSTGLFTLSSTLNLGTAHTIIYVSTHTDALKVLMGDSGTYYYGSQSGLQYLYTINTGALRQDFWSGMTTAMRIRALRRSGNTTAVWENGTGKTRTQAQQATDSFSFTKLGGFSSFLYAGDLAEILIYDASLSDADLNTVGNYLETRYAVTWSDI